MSAPQGRHDMVLVDLDWAGPAVDGQVSITTQSLSDISSLDRESHPGMDGFGSNESFAVVSSPDQPDDNSDSDSSASLAASVYNHSIHHGRLYNKQLSSRYPFPSDATEQDREDIRHLLMLQLTGGLLFFAPIGNNPEKIIDIATGTGIWAVQGSPSPSRNYCQCRHPSGRC